MKRKIALLVLLLFCAATAGFSEEPAWEDISRGVLEISTALVEGQSIYFGSSRGVYKSEDKGSSWRNIMPLGGQKKTVHSLLFSPEDKTSLFAATSQGLFMSADTGKTWSRIFTGKNASESDCRAIAILPSGIYLGTMKGLFISIDHGRTWHRETGGIGETPVYAISYHKGEPRVVYAACLDGVYKTEIDSEKWGRIYVAHPIENTDDSDYREEDKDEKEKTSEIRHICMDPENPNCLYLATARGPYVSYDKGKTWNAMTTHGLLDQDIKFLLKNTHLFAGSRAGVFEYQNERWQERSLKLLCSDIRFLAQDDSGHLYAACKEGLFRADLRNTDQAGQSSGTPFYGEGDPGIREVQQVAMKYAEVEPEKIKRWRERAAKKAILPQLSIGFDRNSTDLWHWEGGSTTKPDDDILQRGRDTIDWDLRLSWDLSELIWNADQTSIDVRSRLLVELRDDILDQVTKLYFERLRVKKEVDELSIEDRKRRFEKELRLKELTAMLDALTGGYFSSQLEKIRTKA